MATSGRAESCPATASSASELPAGIFSVVFNRSHSYQLNPLGSSNHNFRWPSFSMSTRSFWTKYCLLCTVCGSAATILAGIFLVVAALFRYYTTSIYYFETVPTYIPAILLSICGVSTIAFSCKRNRNIILLRITACWSLVSAALSSVITITTSLIHMNRLQTLKECVYNRNPPGCTCFGHSYQMDNPGSGNSAEFPMNIPATHYVFENTPDCDVIHGILYSCLRAVFAISVVAVLLSIFLCMLLYQLIGHERKKAYWSRIRRINSDWSADFLACLARPMPRERSSMLPLMMTPSTSLPLGANGNGNATMMQLPQGISWGPPPPYEPMPLPDPIISQGHREGVRRPSVSFIAIPPTNPRPISISTSSSTSSNSDFLSPSAHPFSPTITTVISPQGNGPVAPMTSNGLQLSQLPKILPMMLRESKISIESGSENLYSQDEESFREKMVPFDVKVVNDQATEVDYPCCSSYLNKGSLHEIGADLSPVSNLRLPKKINSLPASPLLNSVKNFLMRDRNSSTPASPRWEGERRKRLNSIATAAAVCGLVSSSPYREIKAQSLPGTPKRIVKRSRSRNQSVLLNQI